MKRSPDQNQSPVTGHRDLQPGIHRPHPTRLSKHHQYRQSWQGRRCRWFWRRSLSRRQPPPRSQMHRYYQAGANEGSISVGWLDSHATPWRTAEVDFRSRLGEKLFECSELLGHVVEERTISSFVFQQMRPIVGTVRPMEIFLVPASKHLDSSLETSKVGSFFVSGI